MTAAYASGGDEAPAALRISVSDAAINDPGAVLIAGRYGGAWGARVGFWTHDLHLQTGAPHVMAGMDHVWTNEKWRYGIGAVWIDNENEVNGTRWNFDLSLAYDLSNRMFIEFLHFSHASKVLGIERSRPNEGWNFIGIGFAL
ncbi:MAG: hypothetical protein ACYC9J_07680 [Sulfuricaulis sp.]